MHTYTHELALFIKTYRPDFVPFCRLLASIRQYNVDRIPVLISVNNRDYHFFKRRLRLTDGIHLVRDQELCPYQIKDGWRYQQLVKMHFYKSGFARYYVSLDSDAFFIRDFHASDFVNQGVPYLIKHGSEEYIAALQAHQHDTDTLFFKESLRAVKTYFKSTDTALYDYGPSPYIWDAQVWRSLLETYILPETPLTLFRHLDALYLPSENALYGEYVNLTGHSHYRARGPLFWVYHFDFQYFSEPSLRMDDLIEKYRAQGYLGIIIQSNFFAFSKWDRLRMSWKALWNKV